MKPPFADHHAQISGRQAGKTLTVEEVIKNIAPGFTPGFTPAEMQQAESRFRRAGDPLPTIDYVDIDKHAIDAMVYGQAARKAYVAPIKTLADFSDVELVMHMIERGYAVMKLPKDGGLPEMLR